MHVPARGTRLSAITPATSEARLFNAHHCKSTRVVSRALVSTGNNYLDKRALKQELLSLVKQLGSTAILPGKQQEKARVDSLIGQLKQLSTGIYEEQLYGSWELLYASQGTAVTRTGLGGAMITAGTRLPGVGIDSIKQILQQDGAGRIVALNEAQFGFGPFGSWEVAIEGHWKTQRTGDISTVKVVFEKFKVKPVGLMGRPLPPWLPQFVSSLGQGEETRGGAEWLTPYLDTDLRVGQGKAGNLFLFRKLD